MRDTDLDWKTVAQAEPYWAVLSNDRFKGADLDATVQDEFFRTGEKYVADILGFVNRHLGDVPLERVLDFGCGVGRLVLPFARRAREVVGVDISPRMLELCRGHATQAGLTNVRCVASDDGLSNVPGQFDFVNTIIVLQHIDPRRGVKLIDQLLLKTKLGGVFALQLTYARSRRYLVHEQPKAKLYRRSGTQLEDLLSDEDGPKAGTITMYDYNLHEVFPLLQERGGDPILVLPTRDDDHLGLQLIGRRAR